MGIFFRFSLPRGRSFALKSCPWGGDFDRKISGLEVSPGGMVSGQIDTGEVENSELSENSETLENQFSEVFNSEFSILCYTQNRKVGVENLGDLL